MILDRQDILKAGYIHLHAPDSISVWKDVKQGNIGVLLPQYDGVTYEYSVKADSGTLSNTHSSKGLYEIAPHTDGISMHIPPRILVLFCVYPDYHRNCTTSICSVNTLRRTVSGKYLDLLRFPSVACVPFKYGFYLGAYGTDNKNELTIENINKLKAALSTEKEQAIQTFMNSYHANAYKLFLEKDDILLIDNHTMLHSRSNHSSVQRHLFRYWLE